MGIRARKEVRRDLIAYGLLDKKSGKNFSKN